MEKVALWNFLGGALSARVRRVWTAAVQPKLVEVTQLGIMSHPT